MNSSLNFLDLILNASLLVQSVMVLLMLASLLSWTVILGKARSLSRAKKQAYQFEDQFWSGSDLGELYRKLSRYRSRISGMAAIFYNGFQEFARLKEAAGSDPMSVVEGSRRAMRVAMSREIDTLEKHLPFLATVGSISPYIGLFGTVWGIMHSFQALGTVKQASLNLVAPGIAEALIATAMGLFAAIPAVVAYNKYADTVQRLENRYQDFAEEFANILQRQAHVLKKR